MRYEVHTIQNAECTAIADEALASSDDLAKAKDLAIVQHSNSAYGSAILDTKTGRIDYGNGFGGEPDPASDD